MPTPIVINKTAYDFSDIEVGIDLVVDMGTSLRYLSALPIAEGIEEINYSHTIEREKMYGTSRQPLARTGGVADYEASITMLMYWWRYIISTARSLSAPLGKLELNVNVTFSKTFSNSVLGAANAIPIYTDTLFRCAINSSENAFSRGSENLMVPVTLDPMNIYYSGVDVFGKRMNGTAI